MMLTMRTSLIIFPVFLASTVALAQESYKCNVGGSWVYQDRPCPGAVRRSADMPAKPSSAVSTVAEAAPAASSAADTAAKTKKDQEYINERVKSRIFEREKDEAAAHIRVCDGEVSAINQQINDIAAQSPQGTPLNLASAVNLQLDQERRQTAIAALQAKAISKRAECDGQRSEFDRKYRK